MEFKKYYKQLITELSIQVWVLNKSDETNLQKKNQISRKNKKLVAWMVSHCVTSSLRELYVEELKQFIPVDVFGKCGNLTCPRNETHWISHSECCEKIENEYKFYLAFENSICIDYVTEKFFIIVKHDVVPIIYGGADYIKIAPSNSYIVYSYTFIHWNLRNP